MFYADCIMRGLDPHVKTLIYFIGGRRHSGCRAVSLGPPIYFHSYPICNMRATFGNLRILHLLAQDLHTQPQTHSKVNRDVWALDGVMEVDGQSSSSSDYPGEERDSQPSLADTLPPVEGEEEREEDFAFDADFALDQLWNAGIRDITVASALANLPSPLRCITVADRWPSMPCFGSIFFIMRRSTRSNFAVHLRTHCPRLGFCFWTTQDRCDECGQPACRMHGYQHIEPDRDVASARVDRRTSPPTFYHFLCVHCRPVADPIVVGATMAELRGWNEEFRFIDPISGTLAMANSGNFRRSREWENEVGENVRELAPDAMKDLSEDDEP